MQDRKKVNVKIMEQINNEQLEKLVDDLKKIDGFDFLVDAQFKVNLATHT
jgi:phage terminase large subunit-like protein